MRNTINLSGVRAWAPVPHPIPLDQVQFEPLEVHADATWDGMQIICKFVQSDKAWAIPAADGLVQYPTIGNGLEAGTSVERSKKMTTYQQQMLLAYLGFSPGPLDGVDGVKTNAARKAFERAFGIPCGDANLQAAVAGAVEPIQKAEAVAGKVSADELAACLHSDGFYHIPKGVNIQLSPHFMSREFDCRCRRPGCTVTLVHPALVDACEALRVDVGRPVTITDSGGSGYRCPAHNADPDVGGAPNSLHTLGLAADLHCPGSTPDEMAALAENRANYGEVGKYTWGIHLGVFRPDGAHTRWDNR